MSRHPDQRRNGFTLIEVLIAFVILGVASLALYRGITTGLSGTDASQARITALLLAQSKLDQVGADIPIKPGVQNGTAGGGFNWTVAIMPFIDATDPGSDTDPDHARPIAVYKVAVTVLDRHGYPVTLTSWRLAPGT